MVIGVEDPGSAIFVICRKCVLRMQRGEWPKLDTNLKNLGKTQNILRKSSLKYLF